MINRCDACVIPRVENALICKLNIVGRGDSMGDDVDPCLRDCNCAECVSNMLAQGDLSATRISGVFILYQYLMEGAISTQCRYK